MAAYDKSFKESQEHLIQLKETYGYDNVQVIQMEFEITDEELITLHSGLPIKNLNNAIERHLENEDYRSLEVATKLLEMETKGLEEIQIFNYKVTKK